MKCRYNFREEQRSKLTLDWKNKELINFMENFKIDNMCLKLMMYLELKGLIIKWGIPITTKVVQNQTGKEKLINMFSEQHIPHFNFLL